MVAADKIVEFLRRKMVKMAEKKGSLTHPEVLAISQQLDRFIVKMQRRGMQPTGVRRGYSHRRFWTPQLSPSSRSGQRANA
ncbi:aspartyl-phosphate phosphatase Spo0E family protein [Alicyclobacillus pomorum]|jgi:Spo0E like sporulation regulatory protein|uniref:aspartyl-phosphate phosphatase Spo0E family protein n=1 Tax=Alicyclobacillus pomorum TaxID=204470 RepID=UPI000409CD47|nr:aspartyl-phosphate phosphatase Spo0E family protein [Alicyclobacillus pomorum]